MTDVFDAMDALGAVFAGLNGLTVAIGDVDNVTPAPAALIVETEDGDFLNYQVTMDGAADAQLKITVMVGAAILEAAKPLIRPYLADSGDYSVRAAVAADPTLGGVVTDAAVLTARGLGRYTVGVRELKFYGCEFPVAVML